MSERPSDQSRADKPRVSLTPRTDALDEEATKPAFQFDEDAFDRAIALCRDLEQELGRAYKTLGTAADLATRSAGTRTDWPLDTLCGVACDDLFKAYGIEFPRTHSDLRRCFATAEKYLRTAQSARTPIEETEDSKGDWQCRDYANGWITFPTRKAAESYQETTGALMRYVRHYVPAAVAPTDRNATDG
jgi:hypothetical protein